MPEFTGQFVEFSGFQREAYSLDMCLDEELNELEFRLIYDSDPDEGLPIPEGEEFTDTKIEQKVS